MVALARSAENSDTRENQRLKQVGRTSWTTDSNSALPKGQCVRHSCPAQKCLLSTRSGCSLLTNPHMRESGHILLISLRNLEMGRKILPRKWTNYLVRMDWSMTPSWLCHAGLLMDGRGPCGKEVALEMHRSYWFQVDKLRKKCNLSSQSESRRFVPKQYLECLALLLRKAFMLISPSVPFVHGLRFLLITFSEVLIC